MTATEPDTAPTGIAAVWIGDHTPTTPAEPDTADTILARQLARALERENDLLNDLSKTHSRGWSHAIRQATGLIDHHFTQAPTRELPGLAAARRITADLDGAAPPDTPHWIDLAIVHGCDAPEIRVRCSAMPGAPCRETCVGALRGDCTPDRCDDWCDGSLVDAGRCLAASWLGDADSVFADYAGPTRPLEPGPIIVKYGDGGWSWLYAADLPDGVTARAWAGRAAP
jgi:hypothetical protein